MTDTKLDRVRLAKLLAMLGSAHDGEIAAAGRKVEALRRGAGLTWQQILAAVGPREDQDQINKLFLENVALCARIRRLEAHLKAAGDDGPLRRHIEELGKIISRREKRIDSLEAENEALRKASFALPPENLDDVLCILVTWRQHLNDWERAFVDGLIRHRKRRLSPKESATLADISDKIAVYRRQIGNGHVRQ
jgi:hypothetical protein